MAISKENFQSVKTAVLSSLFTLLLLLIINYFLNHSLDLFSGNTTKQLFTVEGTASIVQKPDQAEITFTVSKTAPVLIDAQSQANTLTNTIVSDLQKIGIAKNAIKTSNYSSYPVYPDNTATTLPIRIVPLQQSQTVTGYTVTENVTITVSDITKANSVIDVITKDGAENISGPNLTFSQQTQQSLIEKTRIKAVMDAKNKAQSLANAAGIRLGRIVNIQETNSPNPMPLFYGKAVTNTGSVGAPTQINPGENTITETVTLSYETW